MNFQHFCCTTAQLSLDSGHYFYKKLSLYIQISNEYLGLGFELDRKKLGDLAIVCP